MNSPSQEIERFGWLANCSAVGSLLMCFGQPAIAVGLAGVGIFSQDLIPHVQAVLMWSLAVLALAGVAIDRKHHRGKAPLALAISGVFIMVGTLYVHYDWRILTLAYFLLVASVFLNQNLALKALCKKVQAQAAELEEWTKSLESRVDEEVEKNRRLERLKRFLSPQVAKLIIDSGDDRVLSSHRRFIATVFCDLRGFTTFSENIEPEEAMDVLRTYHEQMGRLVSQYEGTIEHRAGDGLMVIFNDPLPCDDPMLRAVGMAVAMRAKMAELTAEWAKRGYQLGFGVGVSAGFATLGMVGYEERFDYTANGNGVNLASRFCDEAQDGQIIISQNIYAELEDRIEADPLGDLQLKGVGRPVQAFSLVTLRKSA
ncbi:MAG TPA: adenylate/guanylate cyclase domain-containing protein [Gammaproteobacteria bacterium]|nr:adenylate/guanylate cyclase domain-containing protein [Gammaproteobacteria bacterium]